MKPYNNLSDLEKGWVREYQEWTKCSIIALALEQATYYRNLLKTHDLDPSDYI